MYPTILVTLDGSPTDRAIIDHVKSLAAFAKSSVVLLHVITSVPAKYHGREAAGTEVEKGEGYLEEICAEFAALGISSRSELAFGVPEREITRWVKTHGCDLVAMSTHGHRWIADLFLGTTAIKVQHQIRVPVLLLRGR
jgi:nucleotide-binding universal stress UspA family protein